MSRILVADDEAHALRILKLGLERAGFEVDTAVNGEVALEKVLAEQPDALVTDLEMPRLKGTELCERIAEQIPDRKFLVILLTSRAELEYREWSKDFANLEFMEKPVSVRKLSARLTEYFGEA